MGDPVARVAGPVMVDVFLQRIGHGRTVVEIIGNPVVVDVRCGHADDDRLDVAARAVGAIAGGGTGTGARQRARERRRAAEGPARAAVVRRITGDVRHDRAAAAGRGEDLARLLDVERVARRVGVDRPDHGDDARAGVPALQHEAADDAVPVQVLPLLALERQELHRRAVDLVRAARVADLEAARRHRLADVHQRLGLEVVDL